jgi:asparagine synthetase B (glutamine-hydrolysing)
MCGIFVSLQRGTPQHIDNAAFEKLCSRGPDHSNTLTVQSRKKGDDPSHAVFLSFAASVLSLRGDRLSRQPLHHNPSGNVLCWNGEAWQIDGAPVTGSDTGAIYTLLHTAAPCSSSAHESANGAVDRCGAQCSIDSLTHILRALSKISGPYAIVFLDASHQRLFFSRDPLGRRSLLYRQTTTGALIISSISDGDRSKSWVEVETDAVYAVHLNDHGGAQTTAPPLPLQTTELSFLINKFPRVSELAHI